MAQVSRQIGWSNESNLLYQILKQLNKLTSVLFGLKEAATPKYKVYTALLSQSGGDDPQTITSGDLTIGVTYYITDRGAVNWDFTNVGAPNNNVDTYFVATGTTPNNWGDANLTYNTGAPVVTVLENTIGNVWWSYKGIGSYQIISENLFTINKTWSANPVIVANDFQTIGITSCNFSDYAVAIETYISSVNADDILDRTAIEIRVYN